MRFGLPALLPAATLAKMLFRGERARAVFAGMAVHAMMPLERPATAAFGLMLGILAHAVGWPMARGGSQRIADAMAAHLRSLGGEILTGRPIEHWDDLPPARAILFDVTPRQLEKIAGDRLPAPYRRKLGGYRYGPGVFKVDYALDSPAPWQAAECLQAGTVHLGGTLDEIAASERAVWRGEHPERPYVLFVQQTLFDPTRAPAGQAHRLGLLPRPARLDRGHDRPHRGADRALCARLSRPHPGRGTRARPPRWPRTTPTTSAATSTAACRICASSTPARWPV